MRVLISLVVSRVRAIVLRIMLVSCWCVMVMVFGGFLGFMVM